MMSSREIGQALSNHAVEAAGLLFEQPIVLDLSLFDAELL